jgi:hypothetical protein
MARNRTLGELIYDLRAETGRSLEPAHGLVDRDRLIAVLRRAAKEVYDVGGWPHLTADETKNMAAGQRYYDFPTNIEPERVIGAWRKWGNQWDHDPLPFGIAPGLYAEFDSDTGETADPILAWDFYNSGGTTVQYEVWPMPASDNSCQLKIVGTKKLTALSNETDRLELDDTAVVLWAVALLSPEKDRETAFRRAQAAIARAKGRMDKSEPFVRGGRLSTGEPMSRSEMRFAYVRS